jgi:hypothetical protein
VYLDKGRLKGTDCLEYLREYRREINEMGLTETEMKMVVFWDTALYSKVETHRRFRRIYCRHHKGDNGPPKESDISRYRNIAGGC